jgi:membrane-associated phospholipid phosphatase
MRILFCLLTAIFLLQKTVYAQDTLCPYNIKPAWELPVALGTGVVAGAGLKYFLREKEPLDSAYVATLDPYDVSAFDRGATWNYDENAGFASDMGLYTSFVLPVALMADKHIRKDKGKIAVLYLETMAIMGATYTWTAGLVYRNRPYVYNPDVPFSKKLKRGAVNSFFAGHPAAAAASSFFAARIYHDYHPDDNFRYVLWGAAFVPPGIVGYFRYKNGQHFPTDLLAGIPVGIIIGVGIPELHKRRKISERVSVFPATNGLGLVYKL